MTYFPPDELIACIRHELHAEDETGLCDKLFPPLDRRAKFGGVPLGFRTHYDEHDDEQQFYIDLVDEDEQLGTSSIIEQRLRARTQDSDTENQRPIVPIFTSTLLPIVDSPIVKANPTEMRELETLPDENPWTIFSKFEASAGQRMCCLLEIIYVPRASTEQRVEFKVSVVANAKIWQVIGVCCLVYHRESATILGGEPSDYELYITDDGEVESDFPPLETARSIGELGFRSLALIPRKTGEKQHRVTVYFTTGEQYVFELEHLGQTIGWLREKAIERRLQGMNDEEKERLYLVPEYTIETANGFDVKLNAEQTIESTHSIDFVMYRRNSDSRNRPQIRLSCSRANYHPHGLIPSRQLPLLSPPSALLTPDPQSAEIKESKKGSVFEFPIGPSNSSSSPNISPHLPQTSSIFLEWNVERVHKFKPKHGITLRLQGEGLEMNTRDERRRSIMGPTVRKNFLVPWAHICHASCQMQRIKGNETAPIIRIETLQQIEEKRLTNRELTLEGIVQHHSSSTWKSINLQCETIEMAEDIVRHLEVEIVEHQTIGWKVWQHSADGARKPVMAAELALIEEDGPIPTHTTRSGKRNFKLAGTIRRMLSVQKD